MKKIMLFGSLALGLVVLISLFAAMNFGEKSDIYVEGEVVIPEPYVAQAQKSKALFVVLYDLDSPMPMPYGATKLGVSQEDLAKGRVPFFITKERIMTMRENEPPPQNLRVKVRFDRDGIAGRDQPGDVTGELSGISIGSQDITIKINKEISD